jgi:hypothetical protein
MDRRDWKAVLGICDKLQADLDRFAVYAARQSVSALALELLGELGLVESQGAEMVEGRTPATDAAVEELLSAGLVKGEGERLHVTTLGWKVLETIRGEEPREETR